MWIPERSFELEKSGVCLANLNRGLHVELSSQISTHTYLGGNLAQNLGCLPIFLLDLSVHKQTHIRLKCEKKKLKFCSSFCKNNGNFCKNSFKHPVCQVKECANCVKAATGFVLVKSCGTWTVLTVNREYLYRRVITILSVTS